MTVKTKLVDFAKLDRVTKQTLNAWANEDLSYVEVIQLAAEILGEVMERTLMRVPDGEERELTREYLVKMLNVLTDVVATTKVSSAADVSSD